MNMMTSWLRPAPVGTREWDDPTYAGADKVLKEARALLERGWVKGRLAYSKRMRVSEHPMHPEADSWCFRGALLKAAFVVSGSSLPDGLFGIEYNGTYMAACDTIMAAMRRMGIPFSIEQYNDNVAHTVQDVIRVIDTARRMNEERHLRLIPRSAQHERVADLEQRVQFEPTNSSSAGPVPCGADRERAEREQALELV